MNFPTRNWKDYVVLFLIFISSLFYGDLKDFILGKLTFKEFFNLTIKSKKKIISFIGFVIFVIFFIAYEILDLF